MASATFSSGGSSKPVTFTSITVYGGGGGSDTYTVPSGKYAQITIIHVHKDGGGTGLARAWQGAGAYNATQPALFYETNTAIGITKLDYPTMWFNAGTILQIDMTGAPTGDQRITMHITEFNL